MRPKHKLFNWSEDGGMDLQVSVRRDADIEHEILYEEDMMRLSDAEMYMGEAIPVKRFYPIFGGILIIIAVLIGRAFWMQGIDRESFRELADRNRLRSEVLMASRGMITDRNHLVLADNVSTFDVTAVPLDLPINPNERDELLGRVARITGQAVGELQATIASSTAWDQRIPLVRDIPYEQAIALKIVLAQDPAIHVDYGQKRNYEQSSSTKSLAHILGYVGKISPDEYARMRELGYRHLDLIGKTGVEQSYETWLRGEQGKRTSEVDVFGTPQRTIYEQDPTPGKELQLTIDLRLQIIAEQAVRKALETEEIEHGVAIAMDPRDGSMLAIVSWPAYDNNIFAGNVSSTVYADLVQDPNNPFLPRAWAGLYPSGSTIKPVYAVAALAEGIITPQTSFVSRGGIWVGSHFFPDWQAGGHGVTNVRRAIAWSVNTFFYIICGGYDQFNGLGVDKMSEWLNHFGFGSPLGLDIAGEQGGLVPTREWKVNKKNERWYIGDTYNLSIGQGDLLVTPLQIAVATAEVANGGKRITPHLAMEPAYHPSTSTERIASESVMNTVQLGMRDTVLYGSGRGLGLLPFNVAGKTGTAQWRNDRPNHAWFTGYGPFEDPQIAVTVLLEEGEEGSRTAVPVAREILEGWYQLQQEDLMNNQ